MSAVVKRTVSILIKPTFAGDSVMLKTNVLKVIGETSKGITLTRSQKFEVFCNVCDNLLAEGRITKAQHNSWTNVF